MSSPLSFEAGIKPGQDVKERFLHVGRLVCLREWGVTMRPTGDNIVNAWAALPSTADVPVEFRHLIVSNEPDKGDLEVLYAGFIADDIEILVDARKPGVTVQADDLSLDVLRAFARYLDHDHDVCLDTYPPEPVREIIATPLVALRAAGSGDVLIA